MRFKTKLKDKTLTDRSHAQPSLREKLLVECI